MESNYQELRNGEQKDEVADRALDAALAKYAAVEPRTGLEQRILARLRSEPDRIPGRPWWQWSAVGVVAMLLIVATIAWKWSGPGKNVAQQQHPSVPMRSVQRPPTQVATNKRVQPHARIDRRQETRARRHSAPQSALVAGGPKLDQFPSPRPLSDQEKLALEYVERSPEEASLIARAQDTLNRQQELENRNVESNPQ